MEVKEQEKFLEIKKVIKIIESKKEKLKENNIKVDIILDIMNDKENSTVTDILKNLEKSLDYFLMED